MAEGWIKLHRKILDWEWASDPIMMRVWLQLLFDANYEPKRWKGITVERGQLIFGRLAFSKKCGVSEQQIRTAMERLKSTSEITIKTTNRYSLVTIAKYELYQMDETETTSKSTSQLTNNQPTINQQSTTPKEVKKERKKEEYLLCDLGMVLFNEICVSLPKIKAMTEPRKTAIRAWSPTEDELREICERVEKSDFLTGRKKVGDSEWKADFDWMLKPANRQKIIEGKYDNRAKQNVPSWVDDLPEEFKRRAMGE